MKKWILAIIRAPKRLRKKRLHTGTIVSPIIEIEDAPPYGEYKIAKAVQPDYEYLEIHANADLWK